MFIIGLTGGIGCGKSQVETAFRQLGIEVIEADLLAKKAVAPGQPALNALVKRLSTHILLADGSLNRRLMRTLIFQDPSLRAFAEAMIHPHVHQLFQEQLKTVQSRYVVFSIPLLLEHHLQSMVSRVLVVDTSVELQIARTKERDHVTEEEVRAIMSTQVSQGERRASADDLIDNDDSVEKLTDAVLKLHQHYLSLC